jgi:hypothetical protein
MNLVGNLSSVADKVLLQNCLRQDIEAAVCAAKVKKNKK